MPRFELSEAARHDLAEIAEYSEMQWGRAQTLIYLDGLEDRLTALAQRPKMGRSREELAPGLLCFPFQSHVAYYSLADFGIMVVRILHKRRDPSQHFDLDDKP